MEDTNRPTGEELKAFCDWVWGLPDKYLREKVIDMFWKGTLKGSDLLRAFFVEYHTDGVHSLVHSRLGKRHGIQY